MAGPLNSGRFNIPDGEAKEFEINAKGNHTGIQITNETNSHIKVFIKLKNSDKFVKEDTIIGEGSHHYPLIQIKALRLEATVATATGGFYLTQDKPSLPASPNNWNI